jgi:pimeloyl-ACP methyl ester carboxylesterase
MPLDPAPHVIRHGDGGGIPILFVHGNGVDHRFLLELDDVFGIGSGSRAGFERIYLDLPGFGGTPPLEGRGGLADIADWLDAAVGELIGSTPFAVVANSMGGLLARDLVARRPGQSLGMALLAPMVGADREQRRCPPHTVLIRDPNLLASIEEASPADASAYAEMAVLQSRENWERFERAALPGIRAADTAAMDRLGARYTLSTNPDLHLGHLDSPALVVTGKQDQVVGFEDQWDLSRTLRRSTFVALDRAGHNVHLDQPDAVRGLLREWAREVARYAA